MLTAETRLLWDEGCSSRCMCAVAHVQSPSDPETVYDGSLGYQGHLLATEQTDQREEQTTGWQRKDVALRSERGRAEHRWHQLPPTHAQKPGHLTGCRLRGSYCADRDQTEGCRAGMGGSNENTTPPTQTANRIASDQRWSDGAHADALRPISAPMPRVHAPVEVIRLLTSCVRQNPATDTLSETERATPASPVTGALTTHA